MTSQPMNIAPETAARNPAEYPVLGVLTLAAAHGYDIHRHLREHLGEVWKLNRSQVYSLLSKLERDGLVSHERVQQDNLPTKKIFHLTAAGRELFDSWVSSPVAGVRDLRLEFLSKLYFAGLASENAEQKLLADQLEVCREKSERLAGVRRRCETPIESRAAEYRLALVEASIGWLEGMLKSAREQP